MLFSVFTHVPHFYHDSKYYAYSPYVKEMNLWLRNIDEVEVVAPIIKKSVPNHTLISYQHSQLKFTHIPSINLLSLKGTFKSLINLPFLFFKIYQAMSRADHIHIRCPGNIGLIACFVQILFSKKKKTAKYAGNWDPAFKQPWSYRLQRSILNNTFLTRNMSVLVYGDWQDNSQNIIPFFTASYSEEKREKITKEFQKPYKFIFTGSLVEGKRPLFAIKLMEILIARHLPVKLDIYGNGELFESLKSYIREKKLEPFVTLHGNHREDVLIEAYKNSHFALLPSKSEGWPKAIAEAMFFGCIPIATNVSCLKNMLNNGQRGVLLKNSGKEINVKDASEKIIKLLEEPSSLKVMSLEAQKWSQQYTLEKFECAVKQLL